MAAKPLQTPDSLEVGAEEKRRLSAQCRMVVRRGKRLVTKVKAAKQTLATLEPTRKTYKIRVAAAYRALDTGHPRRIERAMQRMKVCPLNDYLV
jgi:hypothetical protein